MVQSSIKSKYSGIYGKYFDQSIQQRSQFVVLPLAVLQRYHALVVIYSVKVAKAATFVFKRLPQIGFRGVARQLATIS